jgi:heat shock protein HslJ
MRRCRTSPLAVCSLVIAAALALSPGVTLAQSPSPPHDAATPSASAAASAASASGAASVPPASPEPDEVQPEGTWQVTAYDAWGDGLVAPLPGSTLTVSLLSQGRLEGQTGCGTYIGGYSVDGQSIRLGVISKGPDPCGERLTDEAFAFSQALGVATSWLASPSGLDLRDQNGQVRVTMVQPGGEGLAGEWLVQRYARPDGTLREVLAGSEVTLSLGEDGRVAGSTGCRIFAGEYEAETDRIVIAIDVVGLPCEGEERRQDRRIRTLLDEAVRWERVADTVLLRDAAGALLAELVPGSAKPPGEVPAAAASSVPGRPAESADPGESVG